MSRAITLKNASHAFILIALLAIAAGTLFLQASMGGNVAITPPASNKLDFGKIPLSFEPNAGQIDAAVLFTARQPAGTLYFTPSEVVLSLSNGDAPNKTGLRSILNAKDADPASERAIQHSTSSVLRLHFLDYNPTVVVSSGAALPGKVNYLIGNDPSQWHSDLPTYASVTYSGLYQGINLSYEGAGGLLKGTYTVAAGTDPDAIRWRYEGAQKVEIDGKGNLQIVVPGESGKTLTVIEQAPVAWQIAGNQRVPVQVGYALAADGALGFTLGSYDKGLPLTIDPTMQYSTYLGGSIADQAWAMAVDASGNAYITGYTASNNFPTHNGFQPATLGQGDGFVSKFDTNGDLVYSTYLGGSYLDSAQDIAVDTAGNAYIMGWTGSTNFPTRNAFQPTYAGGWDAFVTKLNQAGNDIVYSTFLGGSDQEIAISGGIPGGIAVDAAGNAYIAGDTTSSNFPTRNAYQPALYGTVDAFVTKLDPSGSNLVYSTYIGGERAESAFQVTVDSNGSAIITGETTSENYPTANAFQPNCAIGFTACFDAMVTKFSPDGQSLVYSTFLGGNDQEFVDQGIGITVDSAGTAYVTGLTGSPNFPILDGYQPFYGGQVDAFVSKFSAAGTFLYSTLLGGTNSEVGYDIAVNSAGNFYITGLTLSNDFPTVNPIQPQLGGTEDAILTKFSPNGQSVLYSTYFGGSNGREEWGATGIGLDAANNVYIAGHTEATNFPLLNPYQATNAGSYDVFVTKFSDTTLPPSPTPTVCSNQYTISQSTGAAIVPGTVEIGNQCTSCVTLITLPFPFTLYGRTYSSAYVATNGTLRFVDIFIPVVNQCLPGDNPQMTMLPYWDDLYTTGGGVFVSTSGQAPNRIFNIEWRAFHFGSSAPANFEIRLYENSAVGQFEYIYGNTGGRAGDSATSGVEEDFHGQYSQYSCNSPVLTPGLKLTFTLGCSTVTPAPVTSTPIASSTATRTGTSITTSTAATTSTVNATHTSISTQTRTATQVSTGTSVPPTQAITSTSVASTSTPAVCNITFSDVPVNHTFYASVYCLACKGIISGYADGTFKPDNLVTRGQLAKIVSNAANFTEDPGAQIFEDVAPDSTFYQWINRLTRRGYMSGYNCGSPGEPCVNGDRPYFRPFANATRGQTSKIVSNAAQYNEEPTTQTFEDVPSTHPFYQWIQRLASRGIMGGYQCGGPGEPCGSGNKPYFRPFNNVTRGQSAKIVANTFYPGCNTR